jgi:hypothetical protein
MYSQTVLVENYSYINYFIILEFGFIKLQLSEGCSVKVNLMEIAQWGDPGVDRRIILRRIFRKWDVVVWTGLNGHL